MNKVFLIGRLTRDPELRFTPGAGNAVATFSLAVDRNYVSQNGQREADFINIVCWRKLAENVANNLSKGRLCAVSGSIQTRKYQAQDGSNRYVTEIVAEEVKFLDWGNKEGGSPQAHRGDSFNREATPQGGSGLFEPDNSDGFFPTDDTEIPF
ncbi:single-stranded DNA-binding protein [Clostridium cylindrosporum]|uniref:Single-stranded DNA-binding protein n=1 Tax=Clostridium cylindrosporum DSM 605 TaxID=1121307 RepID=A0A0J8DBU2_CLOCY|nr:single-stranded DNA-binding protein [Clostridium cylindrosporum]KMT21779.1 single-stranded DNA-binding protein 3 [Clostridium cylindrosporum DSM 605]